MFKAAKSQYAFLDVNSRTCQRLCMARKLTSWDVPLLCRARPAEAELDAIANPHPVRLSGPFTAPEFTCLCPVTGQPDFAHLLIDYAPSKSIVESKSSTLPRKLPNHAAFHEDSTIAIGKRIVARIKPSSFASAGTGIRAAEFLSMFSGRRCAA